MYLISYYTLWKHQKSWDFLMFSVGIEKDQWYQMGNLWTFIVFVEAWIASEFVELTMRFSSEHKKSHYRLTASLFSNSIVFSHSAKTKRACLLKWAKIYSVYRCPHTIHFSQKQKQPSRGVLKKTCSENMQQIYRRTPMLKCDFNQFAKQLYWNRTSAWVYSCKFAAYFQNTFS